MRQLVHLLSGDNNLVPFHLWWRKILLKSEKVYKYFVQNCTFITRAIACVVLIRLMIGEKIKTCLAIWLFNGCMVWGKVIVYSWRYKNNISLFLTRYRDVTFLGYLTLGPPNKYKSAKGNEKLFFLGKVEFLKIFCGS